MGEYRLWKHAERSIGKLLGLKRAGPINEDDLIDDARAIEIKNRKKLPKWILDAMEQAEGRAADGRLAIVILHEKNMRYKDSLVMMRLSDYIDWYGGRDEICEQ